MTFSFFLITPKLNNPVCNTIYPYIAEAALNTSCFFVFFQEQSRKVKCKQPRMGFEYFPPCTLPTTINITLYLPLKLTHVGIRFCDYRAKLTVILGHFMEDSYTFNSYVSKMVPLVPMQMVLAKQIPQKWNMFIHLTQAHKSKLILPFGSCVICSLKSGVPLLQMALFFVCTSHKMHKNIEI